MFKTIHNISGDDLHRIYKSIVLTVMEAIIAAMPYGVLYFILVELAYGKASLTIYWMIFAILPILMIRCYLSAKCYGGMMEASYDITGKIRIRVGEHLRKLAMSYFSGKDLGKLSNYLLKDIKLIDFMFSHILIRVVHSGSFPVVIALFLVFIDPRLLVPLVVVIPLAFPFAVLAQIGVKKKGGRHLDLVNKTDSAVIEYVQGITVMKSHNMVGEKNKKLNRLFKQLATQSFKLEAVGFSSVIGFSMIIESGLVLLLLTGVCLMSQGTLSATVFLISLVIALRIYTPLFEFIRYFSLMRYMRNAGERVKEVTSEQPQQFVSGEQRISAADITFSKVSFKYKNNLTLDNIDLYIPARQVTALVGPSGSGKSTLMNLITRLWDIRQGMIQIGDVNIANLPPEQYLSNISIVFQEVYLFNDTVKNNIAIGNQDASDEEIMRAAKAAQCHEFIADLPLGYETVIGEGGKSLSGGEKQRISIARALLKDAPIILLDEATASLDPENEGLIQKAIDSLVASKTVVVIAHRLNTIVNAAQIVVLDGGKIIQRGTHNTLIQTAGLYQNLWKEQQRIKGWKLNQLKVT